MTREAAIKKTILQFAAAYAVALLALVREEVVGVITPRVMAICGLSLALAGWISLTIRFARIKRDCKAAELPTFDLRDPATRNRIVRRLWMLRAMSVIFPLFLLTQNGQELPVVTRVFGVAINLGITWSFFQASRREKVKLEQFDSAFAEYQTTSK